MLLPEEEEEAGEKKEKILGKILFSIELRVSWALSMWWNCWGCQSRAGDVLHGRQGLLGAGHLCPDSHSYRAESLGWVRLFAHQIFVWTQDIRLCFYISVLIALCSGISQFPDAKKRKSHKATTMTSAGIRV